MFRLPAPRPAHQRPLRRHPLRSCLAAGLLALTAGLGPAAAQSELSAESVSILQTFKQLTQPLPPVGNDIPSLVARGEAEAAATAGMQGRREPILRSRDTQIPSATGQGAIRLRILTPILGESLPLVLALPGGLFTAEGAGLLDAPIRRVAKEAGAVVVICEYRVLPEGTRERALDDVTACLAWAIQNARSLQADPAKIALLGYEAGGLLTLELARRIQGTPLAVVGAAVLVDPIFDLGMNSKSWALLPDYPLMPAARTRLAYRAFTAPRAVTSPEANPASALSLGAMPPTFVNVGGYGPLRDEGFQLVQTLKTQGVPSQFELIDGEMQGLFIYGSDTAPGQRLIQKIAGQIRTVLGTGPSRLR